MLRSRRLAEFVSIQGGADDQLYSGNDTTPRLDAEITIRTATGQNDYRFGLAYAHPDSSRTNTATRIENVVQGEGAIMLACPGEYEYINAAVRIPTTDEVNAHTASAERSSTRTIVARRSSCT